MDNWKIAKKYTDCLIHGKQPLLAFSHDDTEGVEPWETESVCFRCAAEAVIQLARRYVPDHRSS